jgi:5-methylcytosine-specific restriction endonuclease McrA
MNALDVTGVSRSVTQVALPAELSDGELLNATRLFVGRSNQLLAALLGHLAEVEARGLHRNRACSSLYTYCIYELRFSEDEAFRRVAASRLVRRFPALLDAVASGELHLTGLLMLGPHLTAENLPEVLARAKHRTKKEIASLVRRLDPLPDVPARIEPLGPAPARLVPETPTWSRFVESLCPVRELTAGDRPGDWTEAKVDSDEGSNDVPVPEPVTTAPERLDPQRYRVQFTAGEEYVKLVEEAQALLSHSESGKRVALDELQLRAMRSLVAELSRKKRAATARPRKAKASTPAAAKRSEHPRQRDRHIPASIRRAVYERDQNRCTFIDSGQRCRETHCLELHHLKAFARGGEHSLANLALHCRPHNALAAEQDFGTLLLQRRRDSIPHELENKEAGELCEAVGCSAAIASER